jgi:CHASE2 domain-containing sensor protein
MMDKDSISPVVENDKSPSPRDQIAGLVSDVQSLARAEWDYTKARLSYSGGIARKAGLYALLAVLAVTAAAIALVLGTLLILTAYWGPLAATAIVVVIFSFLALLCAVMARKTARNLSFTENDDYV